MRYCNKFWYSLLYREFDYKQTSKRLRTILLLACMGHLLGIETALKPFKKSKNNWNKF